jgi:hypothetical protein
MQNNRLRVHQDFQGSERKVFAAVNHPDPGGIPAALE